MVRPKPDQPDRLLRPCGISFCGKDLNLHIANFILHIYTTDIQWLLFTDYSSSVIPHLHCLLFASLGIDHIATLWILQGGYAISELGEVLPCA